MKVDFTFFTLCKALKRRNIPAKGTIIYLVLSPDTTMALKGRNIPTMGTIICLVLLPDAIIALKGRNILAMGAAHCVEKLYSHEALKGRYKSTNAMSISFHHFVAPQGFAPTQGCTLR